MTDAKGEFIPMPNLHTNLVHMLHKTDTYIALPAKLEEAVFDKLDRNDYTFVKVQDGNLIEVVKLFNHCGYLQVERGVEGTQAHAFPCGACVETIVTPEAVKALVCQLNSCDDDLY